MSNFLPLKVGQSKHQTAQNTPHFALVETLVVGDPGFQFFGEGAGAILVEGNELMHDGVFVAIVIGPDFIVDEGEKVAIFEVFLSFQGLYHVFEFGGGFDEDFLHEDEFAGFSVFQDGFIVVICFAFDGVLVEKIYPA